MHTEFPDEGCLRSGLDDLAPSLYWDQALLRIGQRSTQDGVLS